MQVSEVMTLGCETIGAGESLQAAAQRMRDQDIGALFVSDDSGQVIGIITDRDITVRAVAAGVDAGSEVSQFMSRDVISCYQNDALETAANIMEEQQIRRLMVCDEQDQPVGMLSQADIARVLGRAPLTDEMLRHISEPGGQHSQRH